MSDLELIDAVAQKTGEDARELRRRSFMLTNPEESGSDIDHECMLDLIALPETGTVDWDALGFGCRGPFFTSTLKARRKGKKQAARAFHAKREPARHRYGGGLGSALDSKQLKRSRRHLCGLTRKCGLHRHETLRAVPIIRTVRMSHHTPVDGRRTLRMGDRLRSLGRGHSYDSHSFGRRVRRSSGFRDGDDPRRGTRQRD